MDNNTATIIWLLGFPLVESLARCLEHRKGSEKPDSKALRRYAAAATVAIWFGVAAWIRTW